MAGWSRGNFLALADHGNTAGRDDKTTGPVVLLVGSEANPLAHPNQGNTGGRDDKTSGPVVLLVDSDDRAVRDHDILVQNCVLDNGITANPGVVHDDCPLHPGPAVDPHTWRENRVQD